MVFRVEMLAIVVCTACLFLTATGGVRAAGAMPNVSEQTSRDVGAMNDAEQIVIGADAVVYSAHSGHCCKDKVTGWSGTCLPDKGVESKPGLGDLSTYPRFSKPILQSPLVGIVPTGIYRPPISS